MPSPIPVRKRSLIKDSVLDQGRDISERTADQSTRPNSPTMREWSRAPGLHYPSHYRKVQHPHSPEANVPLECGMPGALYQILLAKNSRDALHASAAIECRSE